MTFYPSYTEYLYEFARTIWYAGAIFQPTDSNLVAISGILLIRSLRAAYYEGVLHPDVYESAIHADDDYDCIPF